MQFAGPGSLWRKLGAPTTAPLVTFANAVIGGCLAAALVLGAYEIVERTWLHDVDMAQLHFYHRVRGVTTAVVAAMVAALQVLRAGPTLFTADGGSEQALRPQAPKGAVRYAQWFILMRWIAVIIAAVLVFVAVRVLDYLPAAVWWPLVWTIAAMAALNIVYTFAVRARGAGDALLITQVYGDLVLLTVLLHFSGGVENPLSAVMLFHVIIGGIVLTRRQCYLVAVTASALFGLLVWAEWAGVVAHYTLAVFPHYAHDGQVAHAAHDAAYTVSRVGLQAAMMFLTAYFATTMTRQLRRDERQIELFADRAAAQSQLLERALETTGTGLCVTDTRLRPTWSNEGWRAVFPSGDAGTCCPTLPAGADQARRTIEDGKTRVTELTLPLSTINGRHHTADQRSYLLTTAPLLDKDGRITLLVALTREVTEQKRIQERLIRTEKLAAIGELAGKVAHEVNNPIAIISAKARLLLSDHRDDLSTRTADELVKITDLSDRVARIAQGLLSYCRPSASPVALIDVCAPIRKALTIIEPAAGAARVELSQRLPNELPAVRINGGEMEQVFVNLFMNALDAMPHGGRLAVSARTDECAGQWERWVVVDVEDTGCGIPDEIRDRVFEPFLTTKPEGKGTGLGLSICLGLLRSNGGTIDLDSVPGRGTRATVRLPISRSAT